jgi:hypothetical protein
MGVTGSHGLEVKEGNRRRMGNIIMSGWFGVKGGAAGTSTCRQIQQAGESRRLLERLQ